MIFLISNFLLHRLLVQIMVCTRPTLSPAAKHMLACALPDEQADEHFRTSKTSSDEQKKQNTTTHKS